MTCPNCGTNAPIPDAAIPEAGLSLLCSSCKATFTGFRGGFTMRSSSPIGGPPEVFIVRCPACSKRVPIEEHEVLDSGTSLSCSHCGVKLAVFRGGGFTMTSALPDSPKANASESAPSGRAEPGQDPMHLSQTWPPFSTDYPREPVSEIPVSSVIEDGDHLGQFEIVRMLGAGSSGAVYQVWDRVVGELKAVKIIATGPERSERARLQVLNEARVRRRLRCIGNLLLGDGVVWIPFHRGLEMLLLPMEYAEGGSLRHWLELHRPDTAERRSEGLGLWLQACDGVAALHDVGIVHLDLKPENILLTGDGRNTGLSEQDAQNWRIRVADFGSSRCYSESGTEAGPPTCCTPLYASPEQIEGGAVEQLDQRSDVYSLGIILYEILDEYGKPPFGGTLDAVRDGHLRKQPNLRPIPEELRAVVDKALMKPASDRYSSVIEFKQAVELASMKEN